MDQPRRRQTVLHQHPTLRAGDSLPGLATYVDALGRITLLTTDRLGSSLLGGLGEDDIWVSDLIDGAWSEPRNLNDVSGAPRSTRRSSITAYRSPPTGTRPFGHPHVPAGLAATTSGPHAASTANGAPPRISGRRSTGRAVNTTRSLPRGHRAVPHQRPRRRIRRRRHLHRRPRFEWTVGAHDQRRCDVERARQRPLRVLDTGWRDLPFRLDRGAGFGSKDLWWTQSWK